MTSLRAAHLSAGLDLQFTPLSFHWMRLRNLLTGVLLLVLQASSGSADVPTLQTVSFYSKALDKQTTYIAALPNPIQPGKKYPVLYLLHGAWGSYRDWTQNTSISEMLRDLPLVVITPDGGQFGWYLDSSRESASTYESFLTRDLINDVDARFQTSPTRTARAICGLSMGGHGALSLAAKHPDLFGSASSMSGILRLQNHPKKWELEKRLGPLQDAAPEWSRHSVYDLVDQFTSTPVALLLDCGTSDSVGALTDNRQVHERLSNRGIKHTYREFPGTHDWKYWGARLPEHLHFHLASFAHPATLPPPTQKPDHYRVKTLQFEKENSEKWQHDTTTRPIVLLGSSSFEILKANELFPGWVIANRGIGGDRIGLGDYRGILHRLYCSVFDCHPRAVFILNGTNDLGQTAHQATPTVDEVADCFEQVVQRIREGVPDAQIVIVSCTPTRDSHAAASPFIKMYNEKLKTLAARLAGDVQYVDTYSRVVGEDGLLKPEFSRDGLHMNPAGYEQLRQEFLKVMK